MAERGAAFLGLCKKEGKTLSGQVGRWGTVPPGSDRSLFISNPILNQNSHVDHQVGGEKVREGAGARGGGRGGLTACRGPHNTAPQAAGCQPLF